MAEQDKLGMASEWETPAAAVEEPKQPEAPKQKFVREYDLQDGSGKQRFEADSQEELIDKIAQAHENASRQIHKLQRDYKELSRGKTLQPEKQSSDFQELKPTSLKADDILPLQSNPNELFRRMFQAEIGISPQEFLLRENERRRQEAEFRAQREFVERHQAEYTPTPENAQTIMRFLQKENLPVSKKNLDYAFEELRGELGSVKERVTQVAPEPKPSAPPPAQERQASPPPSFIRPSLGGRAMEDVTGGTDVTSADFARIAQLPPAEMKARIEQIFRSSRTGR